MKKYAFLHKNFRNLDSEKKTIFLASAGTMFLCLFPWYAEYPVYEAGQWFNAFGGSWYLLGSAIAFCSLLIVLHIGDELLETEKINLPFSENKLYLGAGLEGLLLVILTWSVLQNTAHSGNYAEVRYGIVLSTLLQFVVVIATILRMKDTKKQVVENFFDLPQQKTKKVVPQAVAKPTPKKEEHDHHHPQNLLDIDS